MDKNGLGILIVVIVLVVDIGRQCYKEQLNSFVLTTISMSKSISAIITLIIAVNIMFAADLSAAPGAYAQNTTTTPPRITTNSTSITMPSIAGLNETTIINAINTKIKLIYDGDNGEEPNNSTTTMTTTTTTTKVAHEQTK